MQTSALCLMHRLFIQLPKQRKQYQHAMGSVGAVEVEEERVTRGGWGRRYGPCEAGDLERRMKRAVAALGAQEIESIVAEQGKIEVRPLPARHGRHLQKTVHCAVHATQALRA